MLFVCVCLGVPLTTLQRAWTSTIWASRELISSCCRSESSTFLASSSDRLTTCLFKEAKRQISSKHTTPEFFYCDSEVMWTTHKVPPHTPSSAPVLALHTQLFLLWARWPEDQDTSGSTYTANAPVNHLHICLLFHTSNRSLRFSSSKPFSFCCRKS